MGPVRWDRQFSEEYDFPATPTRVQYVLCTTGRSGSHYLGHLLHARGAFGYPLEYMNPTNLPVWERRAAEAGLPVLAFIKSVRTSPNGCFGIKLHHHHLEEFLRHESRRALRRYRFVLLRRRDLVAQAASYLRASQTGAWISEMPEVGPAVYDRAGIRALVEHIALENAKWTSFVAALGLDAMEVVLEDVQADHNLWLTALADFMGVELPAQPLVTSFRPEKQSGTSSESWAQRFVEESWESFVDGDSVPGCP